MAATSPKNQCPPPEDTALARILGDTKPLWDELVCHIETMKRLASIKMAS